MRCLFKLIIVGLLIPMIVACATGAVNLNEGIQDFRKQQYRKAFIRLKPAAERGQPDAQYAIGYMYYYGAGVVEDRKKAWYWINAAAIQGQVDARVAVEILDGNARMLIREHPVPAALH